MATLAYYDTLNYPLKIEEIFKYLVSFKHIGIERETNGNGTTPTPHLSEVQSELQKLVREGVVQETDGFHYLFNREYLIPLRLKKERLARQKIAKAIKALRGARYLPYMRGIFASGSLAIANTDERSDLDVLVVAKKGRIWLARLLLTFLLDMKGVRRPAGVPVAPDKICLNHYVTDQSLHIPYKSMYTAQTYINLIPLHLKEENLVEKFFSANAWIGAYVAVPQLTAWHMRYDGAEMKRDNFLVDAISRLWELLLNNPFGDWLESLARKLQKKRIENGIEPTSAKSSGEVKPGRIVYSDEHLEFHPDSVERTVIDAYNENLKKTGFLGHFVEHDSGLTK